MLFAGWARACCLAVLRCVRVCFTHHAWHRRLLAALRVPLLLLVRPCRWAWCWRSSAMRCDVAHLPTVVALAVIRRSSVAGERRGLLLWRWWW